MAASPRRKRAYPDEDTNDLPFYAKTSPTLLAGFPANFNESPPTKEESRDWQTVYDHCESTWQSLYTWRLPTWQTHGQIARYMAPWRYYAFITANMYNEGLRRDAAIVDRTATLCGEICSAGLMAGLTDPDRDWLTLGSAIPGFEPDQQGKTYYEDLTERLNYVYDHSNFYEAQAQHYDDLVFFGTSPVIDYESEANVLQCFVPCAGEYCLAVGMDNTDDVIAREIRQTVRQTVEMFGLENCPEDVLRMWTQKGGSLDTENVIRHIIEPNYAIDGPGGKTIGKIPGGFTWRETYWMGGKQNTRPLSITGFRDQPFAVSRWDTQGNSAYGRGVGEKMLADCIQLQLETRQKAESIEKVNRPPMGADVSLQNLPSSTNPGKITYFNTGANGEKKFFPLYEVKPDIPAITADIEIVQQRLARTAYNHVFQPVTDVREQMKGQITATEIDALKEEQLIPLGPVIGRTYSTLRSRVKRHLSIMARRGLLPKKPDSLRGVPLKIDFVSMLTEARRATRTAAIARTMQFTGTLVGVWPEARFTVDPNKAVEGFNDGLGGPSDIVRPPREVAKLVQAEEQQKKAAMAMQMTKEGAAAAGALGKTSLGPGNALSALVGQHV